MSVLYFSSAVEGVGETLKGIVEGSVPGNEIEVFRKVHDVTHRLRQGRRGLWLAVILAVNRDDLDGILSIREFLNDLRIILVLPDREQDTIRRGHELRPRYLTYADSDLSDVAAVLSKMVGSRQNNEQNKRGGS